MMDISIFLAKVLGLYFLIVGIAILFNVNYYKKLVVEFANSHVLICISGIISLILGILLIVSHNVWQMDWSIIITIIAWLVFIQGIVRLGFPYISQTMMKKDFMQGNIMYYASGIVCLCIGLFLCYHGFGTNY